MLPSVVAQPDNLADSGAERRQFGRIRHGEVRCNLGSVLDLSRGGVRLLTSRRLRGKVRVVLHDETRAALKLQAQVVWRKRIGLGQFAVGLQFTEVNAEQARWLTQSVHFDASAPAASAREVRRRVDTSEQGGSSMLIGLGLLALAAIVYMVDTPEIAGGLPLLGHPLAGAVIGGALAAAGVLTLFVSVLRALGRALRPRHKTPKSTQVLTELHSLRHLLRCVLDSSLSGVMVLNAVRDPDGELADFEIQMTSTAAEHLLGRSEKDLVGRRLSTAVVDFFDDTLFNTLAGILDTGLPFQEDRWLPQQQRWVQLSAIRLNDSVTLSFADITEQKQQANRIHHEAHHDALTGLPNRKFIVDRITDTIARCRERRTRYALLFLDFDGFKRVNDTLGHEAGDMLLVSIADRIRTVLDDRDPDRASHPRSTAARLGGDEFVVLLEDFADSADAEYVAQRLVAEFTAPRTIAGKPITSTASIGVATSDLGHDTAQNVLRDADAAMYQAKHAGKSCYRVFDRRMYDQTTRQLNFERDLHQAAAQEQFQLHYQPIIDVESSHVLGLEALLRWQHPQRGLLTPDKFLAQAEQLHLTQPLVSWVLRRACCDLAKWRTAYPQHDGLYVTVNLSRRQLLDPSLTQTVRKCLHEFRLPARCLWLEVAESSVARDLDEVAATLHELRDLGVRLALDDFGTGYTSLHGLHMLPFDVIKIDQKLVGSEWDNKRRYAGILHAVLELAHNLDLSVVAEGVESPDQLSLLQGLDCPHAQGWLFSKSLPADDVHRLLSTENPAQLRDRLLSASAA